MENKGVKLSVHAWENSESVKFIITLRNNTDSEKIFIFRTGQQYDIHVLNPEGKEVYRHFKDRFFTQAIEYVNFVPGETRKWEETWNYKCDGKRVEPGEYIVLVTLAGNEESVKTPIAKGRFTLS
ncbi:BsuPI-related putative proteinase inhibitor [Cytobacillus firmus]|uniref:BsuPI-related putative proteinase inhibitor n=1 Tax=Cytobacillus firmus TaxID=1399 RepID=UPI0018CD73D5|nr:BsuPI-related putative proteinase inhibitor [Cytobacillus firmus]